MANKTISELDAAGTLATTDLMMIRQSLADGKITLALLKTFFLGAIESTYSLDASDRLVWTKGMVFSNPLLHNGVSGASGGKLRHFYDVCQFYSTGTSALQSLKITLPVAFNNDFIIIRVRGFDLTSTIGDWECIISGYLKNSTTLWTYPTARQRGDTPFDTVKVGTDGSKAIIVLGNLLDTFYSTNLWVTDVMVGYYGTDSYSSGWSIGFISSESGLTFHSTIFLKQLRSFGYHGKLASSQTTDIANGDHVKFNYINFSEASRFITLDTTSTYSNVTGEASVGRITLRAGHTYRLQGNVLANFSASTGAVDVFWYNATVGASIAGVSGRERALTYSAGDYGLQPVATVFFTPTVDTMVELRFGNVASLSEIAITYTGFDITLLS